MVKNCADFPTVLLRRIETTIVEQNWGLLRGLVEGCSPDLKATITLDSPVPARISGCTPLMLASYYGSVKAVTILVQAGATINRMSNHGYTALTIACCMGHLPIVKLLCELGARMDLPTFDGETLQNLAAQNMKHDVTMFLLEEEARRAEKEEAEEGQAMERKNKDNDDHGVEMQDVDKTKIVDMEPLPEATIVEPELLETWQLTPIKAGFLMKKSGMNGGAGLFQRRSLKRRYFELHTDRLYWFDNDLPQSTPCHSLEIGLTWKAERMEGKQNRFQILGAARALQLQAESLTEVDAWMQSLEEAIAKVKTLKFF